MKKSIVEKYENNKIIRLVYIDCGTYFNDNAILGFSSTTFVSNPFQAPEDMNFEDACKLVSALTNKIEKEENIKKNSRNCVLQVSKLLEKYNFKKLNSTDFGYKNGDSHMYGGYLPLYTLRQISIPEVEVVVDFFTIGKSDNAFHRTKMSRRYFDWYVKDATLDQAKDSSQEDE